MTRLIAILLAMMSTTLPAAAEDGGYLFVTFRWERSPTTEQVHFALSRDGRRWEPLQDGKPVLVSEVGERGVRDPFVLRSHDKSKFFLIGTDLSIHRNGDWGRAVTKGSRSILVWESTDLVNWSGPRLVAVAPDDAGCAWAPEAVYDEQAGEYLVFWASKTGRDHFAKHRIWSARTKDFVAFTPPSVFIDNPKDVIDTTIVREDGKYYRFSKDEVTKAIAMEVGDALAGPWAKVDGFSLADLKGVEGPQCFPMATADGKPGWCLVLDHYAKGEGYKPYVTADLAGGKFERAEAGFEFPFRFRHGSVLAITAAERDRLLAAYGKADGPAK